jgi:hypothetical protein
MVLQSDNGSELIAEIVEKLMEIWLEAKIIHGQACHPQSQDSSVKTMLSMWLHDHKTNH